MTERRVLVLAPFPPSLQGRHGGSRAVARLVAGLARRGPVALAYLRAEDEGPADPSLLAACARVLEWRRPGVSGSVVRPWPRALAVAPRVASGWPLWAAARWDARFARRVRELAAEWRPHVAQAEFTAMAPYLARMPRSVVRVLTVHEAAVPAARERLQHGRGLERLFWQGDLRRWERFERRAVALAGATVVFSEPDLAEVRRLGPAALVRRIPLAVDIPARPADPALEEEGRVLFVGSFVHPPNVEAAVRLASRIFPRLRERHPGARLTLVGESPPPELRAAAGPGVEVTGWVYDLEPYLSRSAVVVAPIALGGGMRVKVAEALAWGKAVVGTRLAFAGLDVEHGTHALVADDDDGIVAAVEQLLADPDRRCLVGRAARELAELRLGADRTAADYAELHRQLVEGAGGGRGTPPATG